MSTKTNSENTNAAENSLKPERSDSSKVMPMENSEDREEEPFIPTGVRFGISLCPKCYSEMETVKVEGPVSTFECIECGYTNKDGSTYGPY